MNEDIFNNQLIKCFGLLANCVACEIRCSLPCEEQPLFACDLKYDWDMENTRDSYDEKCGCSMKKD